MARSLWAATNPSKEPRNREAPVPCGPSGHRTPPGRPTQGTLLKVSSVCPKSWPGRGRGWAGGRGGKEGNPQVLCSIPGTRSASSLRSGQGKRIFPGWGHSRLQAGRGTKGTLSLRCHLPRKGGTAQRALSPHQGCPGDRGVPCSWTKHLLWVFPSSLGWSCPQALGGMDWGK